GNRRADVAGRVNHHLVGISAEQFSHDAPLSPGDVKPQFLADDSDAGPGNHQIDAPDIRALVQPREQPLRVDCTARSGDADGDGFYAFVVRQTLPPSRSACARLVLTEPTLYRRESLPDKLSAGYNPS